MTIKKIIRNLFFNILISGVITNIYSQQASKNTLLSRIPKDTISVKTPIPNIIPSIEQSELKNNVSTINTEDALVIPIPPTQSALLNKENGPTEKPIIAEKKEDTLLPAETISSEEKILFEKHKKEQEEEQRFSFYLKDASFENVVTYMEELLKVKFLPDDAVKPLIAGGATVQGQKVTFKTNKRLTRQEIWDLFVKFLDLANLTIVPGTIENLYHITSVTNANQDPIPCYFNVDITQLPNNPQKVRYTYIVKNLPLATLQNIATSLASATAKIHTFDDLGALIITDKAVNIRSLMVIINELDKEMPEAMSILKLKEVEAITVKKLYEDLTTAEAPGTNRFGGQRKQPRSSYFPLDTRIIAEPRTNSLILLGPKKALAKIEEFIVKHVDVTLDIPYSPLHVYDLEFTDAKNIADILNTVTKFGANTAAGQYGGTIAGEQFFKAVSVTPEPNGNKLIIKAEDRDFEKLKAIIKQLDVPQPQIAIECLIVDVDTQHNKGIGTQFRNKNDGSPIKNVNFQTTGIGPIQTATDTNNNSTLLGNLINLVSGSTASVGTTMFTISSALNGVSSVWGILKILQTFSHTNIVNTPFLVTTNKTAAFFKAGQTRRIQTATVGGSPSYEPKDASLSMTITPTISPDGAITMSINIALTEFTQESVSTDPTAGNTSDKSIVTSVTLNDGDIVALGGLTQHQVTHSIHKFLPGVCDLPIIGALFKSKSLTRIKKNIFFFISPRIIFPAENGYINTYSQKHINSAKKNIVQAQRERGAKDPIDKMFFGQGAFDYLENMDNFLTPDKEKPLRRKRLREEQNKAGKRIATSHDAPSKKPRKKRLSTRGVA